jgi:hypothetical protein
MQLLGFMESFIGPLFPAPKLEGQFLVLAGSSLFLDLVWTAIYPFFQLSSLPL